MGLFGGKKRNFDELSAATLYSRGIRYHKKKEYTEAFACFEQGAIKEDSDCQYNAGALLFSGRGVTEDKAKAAYWFEKAAEQGDVEAQNLLGQMYDKGDGIPQDKAKAEHCLLQAGENGHGGALLRAYELYDERKADSQ